MVSSGRSSSAARACDRDMHVVMLQICKGNKSSELWWSEKGNCLVEIISKLLVLFVLFLSFLKVCFLITVVQIPELDWLEPEPGQFTGFLVGLWEFLYECGHGNLCMWCGKFLYKCDCGNFCMGLVVRVSVWVWLWEFLYGCGLWEFLCLLWWWGLVFEFSSGNFCVSLQVSSQKMRCRVMISGSWLLFFVKV
jgi:hypothetical protein